ncbi:M-phase inducer phosphatase 1-like [Liolophura sinensis]|uniref:M-phase inducer phosphatase 1-like n=1 Tax=Liolophura sinensis TaxID=3198878 RepID=UPI0031598DE0
MSSSLDSCFDLLSSNDLFSTEESSEVRFVDETSRDSGLGADEATVSDIFASMDNNACSPLAYSPVRPLKRLDFRSVRSLSFDCPDVSSSSPSVFDDSDDDMSTELTPVVTVTSVKDDNSAYKSNTDTPVLSRKLHTLGLNSQQTRKRPSPTRDDEESSPLIKRRRGVGRFRRYQSLDLPSKTQPSPVTCDPETEAHIKTILDRVSEDADLISDGSKSCCLPTIPGKHQDLKSITPETLAKVVNKEYDHVIENYVIVDCRYPYEFEGGHIKGAKNLYTRESIMESLVNTPIKTEDPTKRSIIIFHCEFSSERGPKMSRFLRTMDRNQNEENYPELYYPEMYLLHGGYKDFFAAQKGLCLPQSYVPMHQDDYKEDMRKFRIKSKSWAGEQSRSSLRRGLKF